MHRRLLTPKLLLGRQRTLPRVIGSTTRPISRYLNKVQRIHVADCATIDDWTIGMTFAFYAWNSAPVDGTDIVRSYAAIGREFPFPIDVATAELSLPHTLSPGTLTTAHIEGTFPLLFQQRELLKILIEERREHHRQLRNSSINPNRFGVGELVLVRKQVKTSEKKGPAKLQLAARGPYRVLEVLSENTYLLQRLPFEEEDHGTPGTPYKESAARMEKLPSTLAIYKHPTGVDSNWATFRNAFVPAPLQQALGATSFGKFAAAPSEAPYAYEPIQELWQGLNEEEKASSTLPPPPANPPVPMPLPPYTPPLPRPPAPLNGQPARTVRFAPLPPSPPKLPGHRSPPPRRKKRYGADRTLADANARLIEETINGRDRLFFIWYQVPTTQYKRWFLVQIHLEPSTIATFRRTGKVMMRWYIREQKDSRTKVTEKCRYWPEVREWRPKSNTLGKIIHLRPGKVEAFLNKRHKTKYARYEMELHLPTHYIHGPFNWAPPAEADNKHNCVRMADWNMLQMKGPAVGADVSDIGQVVPLMVIMPPHTTYNQRVSPEERAKREARAKFLKGVP